MTVSASVLAQGTSTTDGTTFVIPSFTPTPGKLVLAAFYDTSAASTGAIPTSVTGNGTTYDYVASTSPGAPQTRDLQMYRAMGAGMTAGALSVVYPTSTLGISWAIVEFDGVDTSGVNGAGAIVQTKVLRPTAATSLSTTFANPVGTGNAGFAMVGVAGSPVITPGSGWNDLTGSFNRLTPADAALAMWAEQAPQTIAASYTTSQNAFLVAVELKAKLSLDKLKLGAAATGLRVGSTAATKAYLGSTPVWP